MNKTAQEFNALGRMPHSTAQPAIRSSDPCRTAMAILSVMSLRSKPAAFIDLVKHQMRIFQYRNNLCHRNSVAAYAKMLALDAGFGVPCCNAA
jgi:hypothetical protein